MGSELLVATLAIPTEQAPDWEAAFTHVQNMTRADFEAVEDDILSWLGDVPVYVDSDDIDVEECREQFRNLVGDVRAACDTEHRRLFASDYVVPGWTVFITGGDSAGDSPSEEFDLFNAFLQLGLAEKAGFAVRFKTPSDSHI